MIRILLIKVFMQFKRDRVMLILTLMCTPFFIFLYKQIYLDGMTKYRVVVTEDNAIYNPDSLIRYLEEREYPGGGDLFQVFSVDSYDKAINLLKEHSVKVFLYIEGEKIYIKGNYSDPYYVLSANLLEKFIIEFWGVKQSISINREAVGLSEMKSEFESYIPGLYIFSTLVELFLFTLILMREKDSGLYLRYYFSNIKKIDYYIGNTVAFVLFSLFNLFCTTVTAYILGFNSPNSIILDIFYSMVITIILTLAVTGMCFIVVSVTNNSTQALLMVSFPFMVFVFLSGSVYIFPPKLIYYTLPPTIGVKLLDGCLTYGEHLLNRPVEWLVMLLESTGLYLLGYKRLSFL